ncbi:MAG: NUDIX hydrolase [Chloroflexi bacterium]|nr:NUDIX hydrolase [Chloroflexota bacterium]
MLDSSPRHIVAASALIRNAKGEVALVRTERRGWELPGGQVELGESLIAGLEREIYEECGLHVEIERLLQVRSNLSSSIVIFCFQATYVGGDLRGSAETPEVRWADPQAAQDLITHPALRRSFSEMLANDNGLQYQAYRTSPFELVETRAL